MFDNYKTVAVIAAHPDDEILGCGATIQRLTQAGCTVNVLILGHGYAARIIDPVGDTDRKAMDALSEACLRANETVGVNQVVMRQFPDNRFDSVDLLDIIKEIERFLKQYPAQLIFTHHRGDLNIDHSITNRAVLTACRPGDAETPHTILCFNVLSSTDWNFGDRGNAFAPTVFAEVTETIEDKIRAISHYTSEIRPFPFARSLEAIRCQARYYGQMVHTESAEAFELARSVFREP